MINKTIIALSIILIAVLLVSGCVGRSSPETENHDTSIDGLPPAGDDFEPVIDNLPPVADDGIDYEGAEPGPVADDGIDYEGEEPGPAAGE